MRSPPTGLFLLELLEICAGFSSPSSCCSRSLLPVVPVTTHMGTEEGEEVGGGELHAWACYLLHQHVETDRKMFVLVLQALFFKVRKGCEHTHTHSLTTVSWICPKPSGHQECEKSPRWRKGDKMPTWATLTFISFGSHSLSYKNPQQRH